MNFCTALNTSQISELGYLDIIPIKERVLSALQNNIAIDHLVSNYFFKGSDYDFNKIEEDEIDRTIIFTKEVVKQICSAVIHSIAIGADEAINGTIMMVETNPKDSRLKDLYIRLSHDVRFLGKIKEADQSLYPTIVAVYLKEFLMNEIESIIPGIEYSIQNLFSQVNYTGYFIFDSIADFKIKKDEIPENYRMPNFKSDK